MKVFGGWLKQAVDRFKFLDKNSIIQLRTRNGIFELTGTDGVIMLRSRADCEVKSEKVKLILFDVLKGVVKNIVGDEMIEVEFKENSVVFSSDTFQIKAPEVVEDVVLEIELTGTEVVSLEGLDKYVGVCKSSDELLNVAIIKPEYSIITDEVVLVQIKKSYNHENQLSFKVLKGISQLCQTEEIIRFGETNEFVVYECGRDVYQIRKIAQKRECKVVELDVQHTIQVNKKEFLNALLSIEMCAHKKLEDAVRLDIDDEFHVKASLLNKAVFDVKVSKVGELKLNKMFSLKRLIAILKHIDEEFVSVGYKDGVLVLEKNADVTFYLSELLEVKEGEEDVDSEV